MIVFDAKHIPFVLAGKTTTTLLPPNTQRLPRVGRSYAIRSRTPPVTDDQGRILKRTKIRAVTRAIISTIERRDDGWHITFQLDPSVPPRLLHQRSERGYTSRHNEALAGEFEAVDKDTLDHYAQENRDRYDQFKQAQKRALGDRLEQARAAAAELGLDVRGDLRIVERRVAAIERRLDAA